MSRNKRPVAEIERGAGLVTGLIANLMNEARRQGVPFERIHALADPACPDVAEVVRVLGRVQPDFPGHMSFGAVDVPDGIDQEEFLRGLTEKKTAFSVVSEYQRWNFYRGGGWRFMSAVWVPGCRVTAAEVANHFRLAGGFRGHTTAFMLWAEEKRPSRPFITIPATTEELYRYDHNDFAVPRSHRLADGQIELGLEELSKSPFNEDCAFVAFKEIVD